jgi:hypothetical protein
MAVALSAFLPFILPQCAHCPDVTAEHNVLQAIIELCRRTLVWREFQTAQTVVANTTAYPYAPAAGQVVHKLLGAKLNGESVCLADAANGQAMNEASINLPYVYGSVSGFELRPVQAAGATVQTYAAVHPSQSAATLPDWMLDKYAEPIATGALYRLHGHIGRDYAQPAMVAGEMAMWNAALDDIRMEAFKAHARSFPRSKASWF